MKQSNFRYYSNEQLEINSIDSKLSQEEKIIRRYLMNYIIDNGQAFNMNNLSKIVDDVKIMGEEKVVSILDRLLKKNVIVAAEEAIKVSKMLFSVTDI